MDEERLCEITERHAAAEPGPWEWHGNGYGHEFHLVAQTGNHTYVMGFARWGTQGAQPTFNSDHGMVKGADLAVHPKPYDPWYITDINHPDAQFLEHSWEDVRDLLDALRTALAERDNYLEGLRLADLHLSEIQAALS